MGGEEDGSPAGEVGGIWLAQRRPATSVKGQQAVPRRGEIAAMPSAEQRMAELVERAGAPPA